MCYFGILPWCRSVFKCTFPTTIQQEEAQQGVSPSLLLDVSLVCPGLQRLGDVSQLRCSQRLTRMPSGPLFQVFSANPTRYLKLDPELTGGIWPENTSGSPWAGVSNCRPASPAATQPGPHPMSKVFACCKLLICFVQKRGACFIIFLCCRAD